jgi:transcriptional regulator with XRE-family HTH domain
MSIDCSPSKAVSAFFAMPLDHEILGCAIRRERERRGLSQEGLAALAGVSRTHIGEIERGATALSVATLVAIAEGLGMKPSEIVQDYELRCTERG